MNVYRTSGQDVKYFCQYKNLTEENDCFCGKVYESELAKVVIETIKSEISKAADMSVIERKNEAKDELIKKEIKEITDRITAQKRNIIDDYKLFSKGQITEQEFTIRRDKTNSTVAELESQLEKCRYEAVTSEKLSLTGIFDKYIGIDEVNRETVEELVKAIYVYPDKRIEIVWDFCEKKI